MLSSSVFARPARRRRTLAAALFAGAVMLLIGFAIWPGSTMASETAVAGVNTYQYWTAVGSTGVVDDADTGLAKFTGPAVLLGSAAPNSASLVLRYNVTANPNLEVSGTGFIGMRYRDNGEDARVTLKLKQAPYDSDTTTTLLEIDSDDFAPSNNYQYQNFFSGGALDLDFEANFYYVELTLSRSNSSGTPALKGMFVGK
jgi:hypothetical protein